MKTKLEILDIDMFNQEFTEPPTKLTWKAKKITLVQRFASGNSPSFRVKGRTSQLEVRLYAGRSLRTRGKVNVGDLVSRIAERLVEVPFEDKVDGEVAKVFLTVAQVAPVATPLPPPREIYPEGYKRQQSSVPLSTFPLLENLPTEAWQRFLVKELCRYDPMPGSIE